MPPGHDAVHDGMGVTARSLWPAYGARPGRAGRPAAGARAVELIEAPTSPLITKYE